MCLLELDEKCVDLVLYCKLNVCDVEGIIIERWYIFHRGSNCNSFVKAIEIHMSTKTHKHVFFLFICHAYCVIESMVVISSHCCFAPLGFLYD